MTTENQLKIFITDDDVFSLNIYEQYLKNMCINDVKLFQNGPDCLNNLHLGPDVILLDHNMDILNGIEVLKKIKRVNPNIYVVMISAQENISTAVETLKYGAFDYIIKGSDVEQKLVNVIRRINLIQEEMKKNNNSILRKILSFI